MAARASLASSGAGDRLWGAAGPGAALRRVLVAGRRAGSHTSLAREASPSRTSESRPAALQTLQRGPRLEWQVTSSFQNIDADGSAELDVEEAPLPPLSESP